MTELSTGDYAPDFELYGIGNGQRTEYQLSDSVAQGDLVLLLFYPFDFSPVCTSELCAMRDAEWFEHTDNIEVWGISADSLYAHRAFAQQYQLNYPLLTDTQSHVAEQYGVKYDWWDGHYNVPKRALFVVDTNQHIAYNWVTDDAYEEPDFAVLNRAVRSIQGGDELDIEVDYSKSPSEL